MPYILSSFLSKINYFKIILLWEKCIFLFVVNIYNVPSIIVFFSSQLESCSCRTLQWNVCMLVPAIIILLSAIILCQPIRSDMNLCGPIRAGTTSRHAAVVEWSCNKSLILPHFLHILPYRVNVQKMSHFRNAFAILAIFLCVLFSFISSIFVSESQTIFCV